MKKILLFSIVVVFLFSFVSAGIVFDKQPQAVYNLGDKISVVIKIIPDMEEAQFVVLDLVCEGDESEVYKEFLSFTEEKLKEIVIPLGNSLINRSLGSCNLNLEIGEGVLIPSDSFRISDLIKIEIIDEVHNFVPGEKMILSGTAVKENGELVWGNAEVKISGTVLESEVIDGKFSVEFEFSENFSAGEHVINLSVYEEDSQEKVLSSGSKLSIINVRQIPTNVEVLLNEREIVPGNSITGKIILHDQTGEKIDALAYVLIKNGFEEIIKQIEIKTDQEFTHPIRFNESPSTWVVSAYSEEILNKDEFRIIELKLIETEIVNQTLVITNKGNVIYDEPLELMIGEEVINLVLLLKVGESQMYSLSAPEGEYEVKIGDLSHIMFLTGSAVGVQKISETLFNVKSYVWVFIVLIFAIVAFLAFRRGSKKSFFARIIPRPKLKNITELKVSSKDTLVDSKKKVELSLSISGTKQNAFVGCVSIKNYSEIKSGKGNVKETFHSIRKVVENKKGVIYNSNGNLFFILAPSLTKTFNNQKDIILLAQEIKEILSVHNKKFKTKIDFGISVNFGTIVTKIEGDTIKFMSLGTLMNVLKKFASSSKGDIYVLEKVKEKLGEKMKGDLVEIGGIRAYNLKEVVDSDTHTTFIKGFLARQQRDRLAEQNKKKE